MKSSPQLFASVAFSLLLSSFTVIPAHALVGDAGGCSARRVRHLTNQAARANACKSHRAAVASNHRVRFHRAIAHIEHTLLRFSRGGMPQPAPARQTAARPRDTRVFLGETPAPGGPALEQDTREQIADAFSSGRASEFSPSQLAEAKVFDFEPLKGSVFVRREPVKYIILHSTETKRPADGDRVIRSWNNRGRRHPGAQFVVDRDGTIYNTVDPQFATVHVDTRKTKYGVNNDNAIGIEIVHSGDQEYTDKQVNSVACLVSYLQSRYGIGENHIYTHHYVQPSDRSDPVDFDWQKFALDRSVLGNAQTAMGKRQPNTFGGG